MLRALLRTLGRVLARSVTWSGWLLLFLLALPVSLVVHLDTPVARRAARAIATGLLGETLRGRFAIGEVRAIRPALGSVDVELAEVVISDPAGRRVIRVHRARVRGFRLVRPSPGALRTLVLRADAIDLDGAAVQLVRRPDLLPTIVSAFEPRSPPTSDGGGPTVRVELPDVRVEHGLVFGSPPGVAGVHADRLSVRASLTVERGIALRLARVRFRSQAPFGAWTMDVRGRILAGEPERASRARARPIAGLAPPSPDAPAGASLRLRVGAHALDGPEELQALLRLRGDAFALDVESATVTARLLAPFGVEVPVRAPVVVSGTLSGPIPRLDYEARLSVGGARAQVRGQLPVGRVFSLTVDFADVDLARILDGAPESLLGGTAVLTQGPGDLPLRVRLDSQPSRIAGVPLPALSAVADVDPARRRILIRPLESRDPRLAARVEGEVGFDGRLDLVVDADSVNLRSLPLPASVEVPPMGGVARGTLRLRFLPAAPAEGRPGPWMSAGGRVHVRGARVGPVVAASAEFSGVVSGDPARPALEGVLRATGAQVAGVRVERASVRVRGGPAGERGTLLVLDVDAGGVAPAREVLRATADASGHLRVLLGDDGVRLDASALALSIGRTRWRGSVDGLHLRRDGGIVLTGAVLASGAQRIAAAATRGRGGRIEGRLMASGLDLRELLALSPVELPITEGRLDLALRAAWDRRVLRTELEGSLTDARVDRLEGLSSVFSIGYDGAVLAFDVQTTLATGGTLGVGGRLERDAGQRELVRSFLEGSWRLEALLDGVDLGVVRTEVPRAPELAGLVSGTARVSGTLDAPIAEVALSAERLSYEGSPPASATIALGYADGSASARVAVAHDGVRLGEVEAHLPLDAREVARDPGGAVARARAADWRVAARLEPISLDDLFAALPPAWRPELEQPLELRVGGQATATGPEERIAAEVRGEVSWTGEAETLLLTEAPRAQVTGSYAEGAARVRADLAVGGARVLTATANGPLPLGEWLRGERAELSPISLAVTGDGVPASLFVPLRSTRLGGTFDVRAVASGVLGQPEGRIVLRAHRLSLGGIPIGEVSLNGTVDPRTFRGDLSLAATRSGEVRGGAPGTQAHVEIPLRWRDGVEPSIEPERPLSVAVQTRGQPIRPFAPLVPGVSDARGLLDGDVEFRGTSERGTWRGGLRLSRATVDLAAAGQRLDAVSAEVDFVGDRVEIRQVRAADGGDTVRASGTLYLRGLGPTRGTLRASFDDFPVRNEGQIMARLQGAAQLEASFEPGALDARVVPRNLFVRLPDRLPGQLQDLSPNPDIEVVGEEHVADERRAGYVYRIWFAGGDQELWVRRSDFSVRSTTDVRLRWDGRDLGMTGSIEVTRGWFEMLGKRFELDRGRITFDNPDEIDPALSISAQHEVAAAATVVTVEVGGRLSRPVIQFSSNPALGSESEVIALLVTGRGPEDQGSSTAASGDLRTQVEQQAASIVTGLTVGLVQSRVREEAPWLQVFTLDQSGDRYRIRAGVPITPPRFLRSILTNVFVQLQTEFQASSTDGSTAESTADPFSAVLELTHPGNLRSTFSAGSTSGRFGVDFTWDVPLD